jgi:beta-phosphoglucomutase-like phosphatase (HAD superfamily)
MSSALTTSSKRSVRPNRSVTCPIHFWGDDDIDADSKPAPDVFEHAAREVGVDPANCIAVEDSKNGVKSAKAAGMTAVGYRTETNAEMDLDEADAVADGAEELRDELLTRTA